jgi:DNA polymerase-3 subunit delta
MYKKEFDTKLQNNQIPQAVMLHGYEYYITSYVQRLIDAVAPEEIIKANESDYGFDNAKAMLSQGSLFGQSSLFIYKGAKALGKNELKTLVDLCAKNPAAFFIYAPFSDNAKSQATVFDKAQNGCSVRFFEPSPAQATYELRNKAARLQMEIADHTLHHLLQHLNMDLSIAQSELEKLSLLPGPVTAKEVDIHVYSASSQKFENFFYELMDNKPILQHLKQLLLGGEDSLKILRQAQYFFEQLFLLNTHIKLKAPDINVTEVLGYKPPKFVVDKKLRYAQRLKTTQYLQIFHKLADIEFELKQRSKEPGQKEPHFIAALLDLQRRFQT